ncbi:nucleoside monophosphate kinase, partial [bacterium]|nr:nucleoside monophosphate kinase [bacterium]
SKGTQADWIVKSHGLKHVSTGDILRKAVRDGSELGGKVEGILNAGELVSDAVMMDLIYEVISNISAEQGWLLDGFPRTEAQSKGLMKLLDEIDETVDFVIDIFVDNDEIVRRLSGRLTCEGCGYVGVAKNNLNNTCSKCSGSMRVRKDDKPETVLNRQEIFRAMTRPAKDVLANEYYVHRIDGHGTPAEVAQRIKSVLS